MRSIFIKSILLLTILTKLSLAATLLPLESYHYQSQSGTCWAYAAAHLLESRSQYLTGVYTSLDVEANLKEHVLYERFIHRWKSKKPFEGLADEAGRRSVILPDEDLATATGNPQEFIQSFFKYGRKIKFTRASSNLPNYSYGKFDGGPVLVGIHEVGSQSNINEIDSLKFVQELANMNNENDASELIRKKLFISQTRSVQSDGESTAKKMFPDSDMPFELISLVITNNENLLHQWDTYSNGQFKAFYVTLSEAKNLIRKSLKLGWPAIVGGQSNGQNHAWTIIGENENEFAMVDSMQPFYWSKLSSDFTETIFVSDKVLE